MLRLSQMGWRNTTEVPIIVAQNENRLVVILVMFYRSTLWIHVSVLLLLLAVTSLLGGSHTSPTLTLVKADEATQVWVQEVYGEVPLPSRPTRARRTTK